MKYFGFLFLLLCTSNAIPVSVMMPLETVTNDGQLNNPAQLFKDLQKLKSGNIDGIMVDVWWGLVEKSAPRKYNWTPYLQLADMARNVSLKMQVVMSFHQCGTNVNDACNIPLPQWVRDVGTHNPDIWYRDQHMGIDEEYLSLGVDNQTIFGGRNPLEIYHDFMAAFASAFRSYLVTTIDQVQVGLGPAGELRYPSYQLQDNKWQYCGIGEFQTYDKYMLSDLAAAAAAAGHPEWGLGGPNDAGDYNSNPWSTSFFSPNNNDNFASEYGAFFLKWYSSKLIAHGDAILGSAKSIFKPLGVHIAAKIAGIHWWYDNPSHAAELTAGYYNTNQNDGYLDIAKMMLKHDVHFDFTCLEMVDNNDGCSSKPAQLVKQTLLAAQSAGVEFAGENALPLCQPNCYEGGFDQIFKSSTQFGPISQFTYLRLNPNIVDNANNWNIFVDFVKRMHSA